MDVERHTGRDGRSKKRPGIEEQRRTLTEAAVQLFIKHGTGAVSISQICASADVSRPTFYRCFPDKEALISHVYAIAVSDHVHVNLAAVMTVGTGVDEIRDALNAMIARIFEEPEIASFLFSESSDHQSPAFAIIDSTFEEAASKLEDWYSKQSASGPSRTTMKATMAACQWIVHDALRQGAGAAAQENARTSMWELVTSVFALKTRSLLLNAEARAVVGQDPTPVGPDAGRT